MASVAASPIPRGARGDAGGRAWPTTAIAIVSVAMIGSAVTAVALLFPRRSENVIDGPLRSVRIQNALGHRCQIENGIARPLPFSCGVSSGPTPRRGPGAPARTLVVLRSDHDHCLIDAVSLEAVLCHPMMIEWAFLEQERVSIAVHAPRNGRRVVQRHLATEAVRELLLDHEHWVSWTGDPSAPLAVFDALGGQHRLGFGALEPVATLPADPR